MDCARASKPQCICKHDLLVGRCTRVLLKEHTDETGGHESAFFGCGLGVVAFEEYKNRQPNIPSPLQASLPTSRALRNCEHGSVDGRRDTKYRAIVTRGGTDA
jgi:hypothetical protein